MKCIGLIVASLACLCAVAESGEQAAAQGVCGVRYLRWHYTAIEGGPLDGKTDPSVKGGGNCHGMQISEIRLVKDGKEISWPTGTTASFRVKNSNAPSSAVESKESDAGNVIDGSVDTKVYSGEATLPLANYFAITLPEAVDFDQYSLYTADDDWNRDPTAWRMEVSADGEKWYGLDNVRDYVVPDARKSLFYTSPVVSLDLTQSGVAAIGAGTVHAVRPANAISARYLRWTVERMWGESTFFQVAEFAPVYCGRRIPWNSTGVATSDNPSKYDAANVARLYDGILKNETGVKICELTFDPEVPLAVTFDLGKVTTFDAYDICAGDPQGDNYRAPGKWKLEAKVPGTERWVVVDAQDFTGGNCPFRRDITSQYRVWYSDYSDQAYLPVSNADPLLTKCWLLPNDRITVSEGAELSLSGVYAAPSAGSVVAGTLALADSRFVVGGTDLSAATVVGTGTFVYPDSAVLPPAIDVPSTITLAKEGGTVDLGAGKTLTAAGQVKAIRFKVKRMITANMIQIAELEIYKNGEKVPWPEGSYVIRSDYPDPSSQVYRPYIQGDPQSGDYSLSTYQGLIDGRTDATPLGQDYSFDASDPTLVAGANEIIIVPGSLVDFDSYRFYGWDYPNQRMPVDWDFDVSYDGVTFFRIGGETGYDYPGVNLSQCKMKETYRGAVDWSAVTASPLVDRVADDNGLALAGGAEFALVTAMERVGALSGAGVVAMSGIAPVLIVAGSDPSAVFSGTVTGGGVLVVEGGTVVMKGADLRGVSKIVVRSGATLKGTARYDESLVFEVEEGGVNRLHYDNGVLLILR